MKRYLAKRILFSIFSLLVVTFAVMWLTFDVMDRDLIFTADPMVSRLAYNDLELYKHNKFVEYGYEEYVSLGSYLKDVYSERLGPDYAKDADYKKATRSIYDEATYLDDADVQAFIAKYESKGYTITYYAPVRQFRKIVSNPALLAVRRLNVFEHFGQYLSGLFHFETINDVTDPNLTDRYIRWEWDERSNMPALVGSGTYHKYLLYFDNHFPFIHQNFLHINLGQSTAINKGIDVYDILNMNTGPLEMTDQEYPVDLGTGVTHSTSLDFHTVVYSASPMESDAEVYGEGEHYINADSSTSGLTRIGNSFVIGILSVIICYLLGLPIGVWMARRKDKLVDRIGNAYIIFVAAVPSLAYIFIIQAIGISAGMPHKWANAASFGIAIVMPIISLSLPSIGGLMKWMRRYMIDQSNSDYVKFARATGMTEGEIFSKHIARNAFIWIVHGVPADILFALVGALITERVYGVPGVGGLLTNGITASDNGIIVGGTVFYSILSIIAIIAGDLLLAKYDPRVSFTNERG